MNGSDAGLFGPGSVTWEVHSHPASIVGGMTALLIQALHPLAMAGVEQHSDYRKDPWGRLYRTSEYLMTATFGTEAEARAAGAQVQQVHQRVQGVDPVTGKAYRADDPELLAWIHNVLTWSVVQSKRRYGGGLSREDSDRYVAEMVRMAELVGTPPELVPTTLEELSAHLRAYPGLIASRTARRASRVVLAPPLPLSLRPFWGVAGAAAIGLMPGRFRAMYRIPWLPPAQPAVRLAATALFGLVALARPGGPPPRMAAEARLAA